LKYFHIGPVSEREALNSERQGTVAILGCAGFIGSHLCEHLLAETDFHIEGLDFSPGKIVHLLDHDRLAFHKLDVHELETLRPVLEKSATVVSLAALCNPYLYNHTPISVIESNFVRIYPLVQACTDLHCRLVHFSTSEVYGKTLSGVIDGPLPGQPSDFHLLSETTTPLLLGPIHAQRWCYASAKQLLERTIFAYGFEKGLDYTIIRPFNFIGPRMDFIPGVDGEGVPRVIACFMDALLHERSMLLVEGGKNRRCFTSIDDAVRATRLVLERPQASRRAILNIGNPENEITIEGLASRMRQLYAEERGGNPDTLPPVRSVSAMEFYGEGYEDSDRRVPDIRMAYGLLDWVPEVALDEALRKTITGFIGAYGC
jgi:UDP-apiose/xylose synthase